MSNTRKVTLTVFCATDEEAEVVRSLGQAYYDCPALLWTPPHMLPIAIASTPTPEEDEKAAAALAELDLAY